MPSDTVLIAAHAWYGDLVGGSFRLATEFAMYLAQLGCPVAYVCCAAGQEQTRPSCESQAGVDIYRYAARPAGSRVPALGYHVMATRQVVRRILQQRKLTAISGHSPLQFLGACLASPPPDVFRNYTVHSPFDEELLADSVRRHGVARRLAAWVAHRIDRWNIGYADRVQADSQYTLDVLIKKHGRYCRPKGLTIPGWVDVEKFRPGNRTWTRSRLGAPWDFAGPIFFVLRRLEDRMGLDTLVRAAGRLKEQGTAFRVLIGGGGPLWSRLEAMIQNLQLSEHVFLLGRVAEEQIAACYAAADCFVLPTRALECFGLIVLESYAAGTPVIAADVAAIPELVRQVGDEWLFPPGDEEQLTARMISFLDGSLRPRIDVREIASRYDRNVVLPRWADALGPTRQ